MTDPAPIIASPLPPSGYHAEYRVNLPENAFFLYSTSNGMSMREPMAPIRDAGAHNSAFPSDDVIIIGDSEKAIYVLVGALTALRSLTHLTALKRAGRFHAITVWQPEIGPDEKPEEVIILTGSDWRALLVQYAEAAIQANRLGRRPRPPRLTGYCSWYYYYDKLSQADFLHNLAAIRQTAGRDGRPLLSIMQIDDGYQPFQGDWLERSDTWPDPMETVAAKIRAAGMTAGIWLMPFVVSTASRVYREHPEWLVRMDDGKIAMVQGWSPAPNHLWCFLDMTIPAVRAHIRKVCRTLHDWGFRYFKLDGLSFGLYPGRYHDPHATAVSAFRQGMQCIREALPDATILACGPVFLPCLGYADSCRCGNDTKADWPMLADAVHGALSRWWQFDRWYCADPDVIIVRHDRSTLTDGERRISALAAILGGVAFTSDRIDLLSEYEKHLLRLGLELHVTDLMPQKWDYRKWDTVFTGRLNGGNALAVINDSECEMPIFLPEFGFTATAHELLHPLGQCHGTVTIPPHDAMLFAENG